MTEDIDTSPKKPSTPKAILWLSILMILLFLYQLYSQFGLLMYMFKNNAAKWDFSMAMYFLRPLVIMPVAAILFALRKKSGWALLSGYFIYLAFNTIVLLYFAFRHPYNSANPVDQLLPAAPANSLIGWAVFIGGCLYFIFKKEVREVYSANRQKVAIAVVLGIALCVTAMF